MIVHVVCGLELMLCPPSMCDIVYICYVAVWNKLVEFSLS